MIFDNGIAGLGYAPEEEPEETDEYPQEDEDMEKYYESKNIQE